MDTSDVLDDKEWSAEAALSFPESLRQFAELSLDGEQADDPHFDTENYINKLFPTEQSLSNIDSVVAKMEYKISTIDEEIQELVRGESSSREDGRRSLEEAQRLIGQLSLQIRDINKKAERSEEMVREITSEIKQLDCAKINLTAAITTLNHLHMLVGGIDTLRRLQRKHLYKEIVLPLQAIMEVMKHFEGYTDIKLINDLRDEVHKIRHDLATQIMADFKDAFSGQFKIILSGGAAHQALSVSSKEIGTLLAAAVSVTARRHRDTAAGDLCGGNKSNLPHRTLAEACLVVDTLDRKIKNDLLKWFITLQLQEYVHLFSSNQETAWLDKIERRYSWLKRHLIELEQSLGSLFPEEWRLSELLVREFCRITKEELSNIMASRKHEIDVKLLLYAIQKTYNFETLLDKRFTGETFEAESASDAGTVHEKRTSTHIEDKEKQDTTQEQSKLFVAMIGSCFEPYLYLYIDSLDSNLASLLERFVQEAATTQQEWSEQQGAVLTSCADLFLFYKKCMVQCTQLTTGKPMLDLATVFQKYLREYAVSVLQASLPKQTQNTLSMQVSNIGRDLQSLSTGAIIQNFQSFLKEGECVRFNKQELSKITSVITTSEYCLETTIHLEQKLKEKVAANLAEKIDLTPEQDLFHKIISNCIQLLVQDLELACEPSLTAMAKISWQNMDSVGDQSSYISQIILHLKTSVPILRDNLTTSRKYFTQFCIRFANSFIPKYIQNIYKCKPISTVGSEQLLLDTHMLKTVLLDLPSIGSDVKRQAPATYSKVVIKSMRKAEMILKLVMSPLDSNVNTMDNYVGQFVQLLPECSMLEFHRVADMKGVKKAQLATLDTMFREKCKSVGSASDGK